MMLQSAPIRKKLSFLSIFSSVLPLLIVSLFLLGQIISVFNQKNMDILSIPFSQCSANVVDVLNAQKNVVDFVLELELSKMHTVTKQTVINFFSDYHLQPNDYFIKIFHPRVETLPYVFPTGLTEEVLNTEWFNNLALYSNTLFWDVGQITNDNEDYLICYTSRQTVDGELPIVISVSVRIDKLLPLHLIDNEYKPLMLVVDDNETVIASNNIEMVSQKVVNMHMDNLRPFRAVHDKSIVKYHGSRYVFLTTVYKNHMLDINNWNFFYMVPYDNTIQELSSLILHCVPLIALCLILSLIMARIISNDIITRLEKLSCKMRRCTDNNFECGEIISGDDEIALLDTVYRTMSKKINTLINSVYQQKIKANEIQIRCQQIEIQMNQATISTLRSQISPHYLYNTLEAIRMKLLLDGNSECADIVQLFAEGFRDYINITADFISITDELKFLKRYITIQKFLFQNRLQFLIFANDDVSRYCIPRFLIQPLVENAVNHGVITKEGIGNIIVEIFQDNCNLYIRVTDNGVGLSTKELTRLRNSLDTVESSSTGIALSNIQHRIRLVYGKRSSLTIKSRQGMGTEIEISLPKEYLDVHETSIVQGDDC